jgi:hypothetical protein
LELTVGTPGTLRSDLSRSNTSMTPLTAASEWRDEEPFVRILDR